jgi:hypothetical protein
MIEEWVDLSKGPHKSRITRLFKYNIWKISNPTRLFPHYAFTFRNACCIAGLIGVGVRVPASKWYGVYGTNG